MTTIIHTVLLALLFEAAVYAQIETRGTVGFAAFPDNSWNGHAVAGGSILADIRSGLLIGVEALFMSGSGEDRDILLAPQIGYEFGSRLIQPYLVGGVGLLRHRDLTGRGVYWSNGATYGAGGGIKFHLSNGWFIAPEARLGWEPFFRTSLSVGYRF